MLSLDIRYTIELVFLDGYFISFVITVSRILLRETTPAVHDRIESCDIYESSIALFWTHDFRFEIIRRDRDLRHIEYIIT